MKEYAKFLERKSQTDIYSGFDPIFMPEYLFDFQKFLVDWALRKGKAAIFADCGLGKTPMQLVWAENIVQKTNGNVLILAPLAVSMQTVEESEKFGIECKRSQLGKPACKVTITNYERLHHFNPDDFKGIVCDESSILKSFDGETRNRVTDFMRKIPYRLLATATAAPNDYTELGTSSEALGELGYMDMLNRFFKNQQGNSSTKRFHGEAVKWRFKGHAEIPFWKWVSSWARALRRPSDFGFVDGDFILPELEEREHIVHPRTLADGFLFPLPAVGLKEQREETVRTLQERCEYVYDIVSNTKDVVLSWCNLNAEGDLLTKMIPDAVQISGKDSDESKEEKLHDFIKGRIRVLITKPKIGAWGLNMQHCSQITYFPSHSYEQWYQGIRRCWRFGQKKKVVVDIVSTEGESEVMKNLRRKSEIADKMFSSLVMHMNESISIDRIQSNFAIKEELPSWL